MFSDLQHSDAEITYSLIGYTNPSLLTSATIDNSADTLTLDYAADQNGSYTITVRATDIRGEFTDVSFDVNVAPVNDAPIVTGPATAAVGEGQSITFDAINAGVIDTLDIDTSNLTLTLTANQAAITLSQTSGLNLIDGDGSDGTLVFSGSQADIDAAINGLVYSSISGFNGSATLIISASDGFLSDSHTVNVTVAPGQSVFHWIGGGGDNLFSNAANWDLGIVPQADDVVIFDGNSTTSAVVDAAFTDAAVWEILAKASFTHTLSTDIDFAVSGNVDILGGTFDTAGDTLTVGGNLTQTGGALVTTDSVWNFVSATDQTLTIDDAVGSLIVDTAGTFTVVNDLEFTGDFINRAGTFDLGANDVTVSGTADKTIESGGLSFGNFTIDTAGDITVTGTLDVNGSLTIAAATDLSGGSIQASGDVNTFADYTGTTTLSIDGSSDQSIASGGDTGILRNLIINKTGGTATLVEDANFRGGFTYVGGNFIAGANEIGFGGSGLNINAGALQLGNVAFTANSGGTIVGNLNANQLNLNSVGLLNGGEIQVRGNLIGMDTTVDGTIAIRMIGGGTQTINVADTTDGDLIIDKTGGKCHAGSRSGFGWDQSVVGDSPRLVGHVVRHHCGHRAGAIRRNVVGRGKYQWRFDAAIGIDLGDVRQQCPARRSRPTRHLGHAERGRRCDVATEPEQPDRGRFAGRLHHLRQSIRHVCEH